MKIKISALLIIFAFAISFSSCTKDDAVTLDVKTLLASKTWTFSTVTHPDPANSLAIAFLTPFYKDQTYVFKSDGTYVEVFITLPTNGSWSLSADEKNITINGDLFGLTISKSSMVLVDADGYVLTYN